MPRWYTRRLPDSPVVTGSRAKRIMSNSRTPSRSTTIQCFSFRICTATAGLTSSCHLLASLSGRAAAGHPRGSPLRLRGGARVSKGGGEATYEQKRQLPVKSITKTLPRAISDLASGEQEGDGPAVAIGQRVDFGRAASARTTDGLVALPPFPPEAERCAFTAEESISTWAGGPPALASAWKRSTQTPFAAQRT